MAPVAPVVTDGTFLSAFRLRCNFKIFSTSLLIAVISHEVAMSVYIRVHFSLSRVILFGLLLGVLYYYYYCYYS